MEKNIPTCWKGYAEKPNFRNQMPEAVAQLFCTKGVLRDFSKFHRKTPVPESLLFIKLQASAPVLLIEVQGKRSRGAFSIWP